MFPFHLRPRAPEARPAGPVARHRLPHVGPLTLALLAALLAATGGAGAEPETDLAVLRARADADLAAISATLPPDLRPSPEVAAAYREAYVATCTRVLTPCPGPEHAAPLRLTSPPEAAFAVPDTDTVAVWVKVFLDDNENGVLDEGEDGIPNIQVSNGSAAHPILGPGVDLTETDGTLSFLTPLEDSRFVFMTVPSGYSATTSFFHRIATTGPDSAYFGLRVNPETADPVFRWVQITDMQVTTQPQSGVELSDDLSEIEALPAPADFIVVTGDLVTTGSIDGQWQVFLDGILGHTTPLHLGYGDHDATDPPLRVANFEQYIGPTCYSFEYGGIHFVMYNDIHATDVGGGFIQFPWLFQDLINARARDPGHDIPIIICKHTMPLVNELQLYTNPDVGDVLAAFSGHWHGSRVRLIEGVFDVNTPPIRYAGIDKSSRGFRINDIDNGAIETEYRIAGISDHLQFSFPADGDTVIAGPIQVRVNGYDSVYRIVSGRFWADGPLSTGDLPLAADGPWAWTGEWDATTAPDGTYSLTAFLDTENGALFHTITIELVRAGPTNRAPHSDWPCYKQNPAGTGYVPEPLTPPLRVAWARYLGGRNNVASPAVAGGRVYVGTSNISTVDQAAMHCLDAVTGTPYWRFPARTDVKSTPAIAGGRVFFSNSIGTVFALDALSGDLLWTTQLGDSLTRWEMTSPNVVGDTVYAGGLPAMSALDATTGGVIWQEVGQTGHEADFIPSIYSAPAVSGDIVVYTTRAGIYAFDRHTGTTVWEHTGSSQQHRSAAIFGSLVYSAGGYFGSQKLVAYDLSGGQIVHQGTYSVTEATAAPAVTPDRVVAVFGGNAPDFPLAFMQGWGHTLATNLLWNFAVDPPLASSRPYERATGSINSTPAVTDDIAYFGADDGTLYAVDTATGNELWRHDLGVAIRSSPAVAGNMLFVTGEDGTLYAFVSGPIETTGAGEAAGSPTPLRTALIGSRPNPFNPATTIHFALGPAGAAPQAVTLRIYDASGRLVRSLIDSKLPPGHHVATWDGRNNTLAPLASGVYHYTLVAGGRTFRDRVVMVK